MSIEVGITRDGIDSSNLSTLEKIYIDRATVIDQMRERWVYI